MPTGRLAFEGEAPAGRGISGDKMAKAASATGGDDTDASAKDGAWQGDNPAGASEGPVTEEWRALVKGLREAVATETAYQTARAGILAKLLGRMAGLAALGVVVLFCVVLTLSVGLLWALTPLLGAWGALGVVLLALAAVAGVAGLMLRSLWTRLVQIISGGEHHP